MAKEKKRGFFSWLGFGKEEEKQPLTDAQTAQPEAQQPEQEAPARSQAETAEQERGAAPENRVEQQQESDAATSEDVPVTARVAGPETAVDPHTGMITPVEPADDVNDEELTALPSAEVELASSAPEQAPLADDAPLSDDELAALALADADVTDIAPHDAAIAETEQAGDAPLSDDELAALALADADVTDIAPHDAAIAETEQADDAPLSDEELAALALGDADVVNVETVGHDAGATAPDDTVSDLPLAAAPLVAHEQEQERPTKEGFFARLKRSLVKTRQNLGSGFISLFRGKKIDDDLFEELEEQLLIADVGVETTRRIITSLTQHADRKQLRDAEALYGLLKSEMAAILAKVDEPLNVEGKTPFVILMVGVNGVGKTTTIGKLARQYQAEGKSVMLAAGDTFRAAAVEQLQVWGQRNNIPVVAQHTGADSASVIFDAIQAAKSRGVDVLIADTAGRLQNKSHLMEELKKITRVMKKLDEQAPHEVMLTLDASTGQNAISQAKLFHEAVGLSGITLTKLDGTAKGGVIFSVADQFGIPIRYIGVGEGIDDLRPFKAEDFIEALFARED
ncbi:signal recognition particle-docking protein FtsY [Pantoea stewartii]|uniref:signal recognition particle-docking protein FtsY n=1 Tax=Pantoea stewartii TaxID=66269 RepID=UPI00156236EA|nr:signal recognition particle-docking protein FtsY [Pantoea stewartii]MDF7786838.1 signal recognition particle-docking protein FtsY [Pantoea stewartii]NRH25727.1 signal recognition particle-docking protein FtsY [Pantoea stewartii]